MVTTRITEATPITIPSAVRMERTGLERNACALNLRDSPKNMPRSGPCLFEKLFGLGAWRIVGRESGREVLLEKLAGGVQIASVPDVGVRFGEHHLGAVGRDPVGGLNCLITFLEAAAAGQKFRQIEDPANLL